MDVGTCGHYEYVLYSQSTIQRSIFCSAPSLHLRLHQEHTFTSSNMNRIFYSSLFQSGGTFKKWLIKCLTPSSPVPDLMSLLGSSSRDDKGRRSGAPRGPVGPRGHHLHHVSQHHPPCAGSTLSATHATLEPMDKGLQLKLAVQLTAM